MNKRQLLKFKPLNPLVATSCLSPIISGGNLHRRGCIAFTFEHKVKNLKDMLCIIIDFLSDTIMQNGGMFSTAYFTTFSI